MPWQELIYAFAKAVAGFGVVLGLFIAVQYFIRRQSGCANANKDLLDYMPHGCANCSRSADGKCRRNRMHNEETHHHELA
jgi:hypothetical protein